MSGFTILPLSPRVHLSMLSPPHFSLPSLVMVPEEIRVIRQLCSGLKQCLSSVGAHTIRLWQHPSMWVILQFSKYLPMHTDVREWPTSIAKYCDAWIRTSQKVDFFYTLWEVLNLHGLIPVWLMGSPSPFLASLLQYCVVQGYSAKYQRTSYCLVLSSWALCFAFS